MARTTRTKRPGSAIERPDVYQQVTDRILASLESGTIPWQKPWASDPDGASMPTNVRGTRYRGINVWLLAMAGFRSPYWLTFNQARELGGHVRRHATSTEVILWKPTVRKPTRAEIAADPDAPMRQSLIIRTYRVFNLVQVSLPGRALWKLGGRFPLASADTAPAFDPNPACDAIVAGMPDRPPIGHGGSRAFYQPGMDAVQMPARPSFHSPAEYYGTLFHELAHATGHERRLNRPSLVDATTFGDTNYSEEELIAEFASAFVAGHAGISPAIVDNSAAYIAGWARAFKDDPKMVVMAAQRAQKAADWILGTLPASSPIETADDEASTDTVAGPLTPVPALA